MQEGPTHPEKESSGAKAGVLGAHPGLFSALPKLDRERLPQKVQELGQTLE